MKLHRMISYGLMMAGAVAAVRAIAKRQAWEQANIHVGIMLDWDDVQAVATRASTLPSPQEGEQRGHVEDLLGQFKEVGATHLSIPELSLKRLLAKGVLSVDQGSVAGRVYLRAQNAALAELVTTELQARLPQIKARRSRAKNPLISFAGDLPSVAELGLGFDPAQAELAHKVGLLPVARPIGYSWVQPEMIERSLDQAAELGAKTVAVQGDLIPGHEFNLAHTVAAMKRNHLHYAYFRESRHQKGDWFLAKSLIKEGLLILAHEFGPVEMLPEDSGSISYRWANLAVEAGVRLCSVRFFRVLHAADPLEALTYVKRLAQALRQAGFVVDRVDEVDLTPFQPRRDELTLAMAGLSTAGAAGLASDLFPVSDSLKLMGLSASAAALTGLPFLEKLRTGRAQAHTPAHHHQPDPDHDHQHHHDHSPSLSTTAYAPKGLALAAMVAYPVAAGVLNSADPLPALSQSLAISAAGATALSATTVEDDYLLGIEEYRSYNLDWLLPLGLAAARVVTQNKKGSRWWSWLPLAGIAMAAYRSLWGQVPQDLPGSFDREHQQEHTHHLSAWQRVLGDSKMAVSPRPLRKWSLLAPLGAVTAALLQQRGKAALAAMALIPAIAGQVAILTGFRNGQRPLEKTFEGRAKGWTIGAAIAGVLWLFSSLFNVSKREACHSERSEESL